MAKFGQGFLTSLTRPSYLDRLGTTGMMIGQMPGQVMKQRRDRQFMEEYAAGSPVQRAEMLKQKAMKEGNISLFEQGTKMGQAAMADGAKMGVNALITQIGNPQTSDELAKQSTQTALQLIRDNNLDEASYMREILAADKRRTSAVTNGITERDQAAATQAQFMIQSGRSKEEYLQQFPERGHIWDNTEMSINERRNQYEDADAARIKQQGLASIDIIKGKMQTEQDPARLRQLEDAMVSVAKQTGIAETSSYIGMAEQIEQARIDARIEAEDKRYKLQEREQEKFVTSQVEQMLKTGISRVPEYITQEDGTSVPIPEEIRVQIAKKYKEDEEALRVLREAELEGTLPSDYLKVANQMITENPDYVKNIPAFEQQLKFIQDNKPEEGTLPSRQYINAAKSVATAINGYKAMLRKQGLTEDQLKRRVQKQISDYLGMFEAPTDYFGSDYVYTLLSDPEYAEERELLENNMVQELKAAGAGNIPFRQLVDAAIKGTRLEGLVDDEAAQRTREDEILKQREEERSALIGILEKKFGTLKERKNKQYTASEIKFAEDMLREMYAEEFPVSPDAPMSGLLF